VRARHFVRGVVFAVEVLSLALLRPLRDSLLVRGDQDRYPVDPRKDGCAPLAVTGIRQQLDRLSAARAGEEMLRKRDPQFRASL
jgi:hypothetical protein